MLTKFKQNLKIIDIFGQQITLSFRQQEQYRTSFGGFLSICIIGIIVSFFYSNILDFFAKNTVATTTQLKFDENPEPFIFKLSEFMFAVQIEHDNFTTNPLFNVTLEQRLYTRDKNGTQTKQPTTYIDLIPCTLDHFQPIFDKYGSSVDDPFKQNNLGNFLCPNLNHTLSQNLTIGGSYQSTNYYFLKFVVSSCRNQSTNLSWKPVCQSQEALQKKLASAGSFRFQIYTTNFLINPNDPHNFIKPYISIDQFYSFVPNSTYVQSDIFFRPKDITTDEGILMYPNQKTETIANRDIGDYRQQISISGLSSTNFGAFYFVRSPYSYSINRSYMKLAELLSYLGGFAQFMIAILGIFIRFYNREHMIIELANDLYQFDLNKKRENTQLNLNKLLSQSQHGRQKLKKSIKDAQLDSKLKIIQPFYEQNNQLTPSDMKICESFKVLQPKLTKQISKKKICTTKIQKSKILEEFKSFMTPKRNIGISLRLILSQVLPFDFLKSDECIVIQRAIDQVNKEFDVQFMMKQLHEIIKLKKVLFNDEQIKLFNFSQKPKICLTQEKRRRSNRQSTIIKSIQDFALQEEALSDLFISLVQSYQKIIGLDSDDMTEEQLRFNTRLISLLGAKLPRLIEKELEQASDEDSPNQAKEDNLMSNLN